MKLDLGTKLYVQLKPTLSTRLAIETVQANLRNDVQSTVSSEELHLTIIHIGTIERLLSPLKLSPTPFVMRHIHTLVSELQDITERTKFSNLTLRHEEYAYLGTSHNSYALILSRSPTLDDLHDASLQKLKQCLHNLGVEDPTTYMKYDQNLQYALSLYPHVTIARARSVTKQPVSLHYMNFEMMPVVY